MNQNCRRPIDAAVYSGPAIKSEAQHAKPTDGIKAGIRAIYEPEDCRSEKLSTLLQLLGQKKVSPDG